MAAVWHPIAVAAVEADPKAGAVGAGPVAERRIVGAQGERSGCIDCVPRGCSLWMIATTVVGVCIVAGNSLFVGVGCSFAVATCTVELGLWSWGSVV